MVFKQAGKVLFRRFWAALVLLSFLAGCQAGDDGAALTPLSLPEFEAVALDGEPLQVVATTSIVGDVVGQVGGEAIALTVLMSAGQDPHSYEPAAGDLTAVADAHVIFVNGWNLEEGLIDDLANIAAGVPQVPVSAGLQPLAFGQDEHEDEALADDTGSPDPHTWLDPRLVVQWVENIRLALTALDPANAALYRRQADGYNVELAALIAYYDEQMAAIPPGRRRLVTNHDSLGYLAAAYDFEIIGAIVPGGSTLAEPKAGELAALTAALEGSGACTIFTETTAADSLAQAVAAELTSCDKVQIVPLYTGSIGLPGSSADSYLQMMYANMMALGLAFQGG